MSVVKTGDVVSFVGLRRCELSTERELKGSYVMKKNREEKKTRGEHGGRGEQLRPSHGDR
jgi:hypothetical protein